MSKGYFWLKFAKTAAAAGQASETRAEVKTGKAPNQGTAAAGGFLPEGYTIRPRANFSEKQAVATLTFIPESGTTIPCALYTVTDAANVTTAYRAKKQGEADAERATQRFKDWAADGVPVLVELELQQLGPDEI